MPAGPRPRDSRDNRPRAETGAPRSTPAELADRLRVQLALPAGQGRIGRHDLAELLDALDRLRAYAQHLPTCGYFTQQRPYGEAMLPGACTCGFRGAVEGEREESWAGRVGR